MASGHEISFGSGLPLPSRAHRMFLAQSRVLYLALAGTSHRSDGSNVYVHKRTLLQLRVIGSQGRWRLVHGPMSLHHMLISPMTLSSH